MPAPHIVCARKIETHKVNPTNDLVEIAVMDSPGSGGANHAYVCYWPTQFGIREAHIGFQNGPIKEAGVNGLTHEVLLAIVEDRLQSFQNGPYACEENAKALEAVQSAQQILQARTKARMQRGVEGTLKS